MKVLLKQDPHNWDAFWFEARDEDKLVARTDRLSLVDMKYLHFAREQVGQALGKLLAECGIENTPTPELITPALRELTELMTNEL